MKDSEFERMIDDFNPKDPLAVARDFLLWLSQAYNHPLGVNQAEKDYFVSDMTADDWTALLEHDDQC